MVTWRSAVELRDVSMFLSVYFDTHFASYTEIESNLHEYGI